MFSKEYLFTNLITELNIPAFRFLSRELKVLKWNDLILLTPDDIASATPPPNIRKQLLKLIENVNIANKANLQAEKKDIDTGYPDTIEANPTIIDKKLIKKKLIASPSLYYHPIESAYFPQKSILSMSFANLLEISGCDFSVSENEDALIKEGRFSKAICDELRKKAIYIPEDNKVYICDMLSFPIGFFCNNIEFNSLYMHLFNYIKALNSKYEIDIDKIIQNLVTEPILKEEVLDKISEVYLNSNLQYMFSRQDKTQWKDFSDSSEYQIVKNYGITRISIRYLSIIYKIKEKAENILEYKKDSINFNDSNWIVYLQESLFSRCFKNDHLRNGEILADRYGINAEGCCKTLTEVGEKFSITRERVRQVQYKGEHNQNFKYIIQKIQFLEFAIERYLEYKGGVLSFSQLEKYIQDLFPLISQNSKQTLKVFLNIRENMPKECALYYKAESLITYDEQNQRIYLRNSKCIKCPYLDAEVEKIARKDIKLSLTDFSQYQKKLCKESCKEIHSLDENFYSFYFTQKHSFIFDKEIFYKTEYWILNNETNWVKLVTAIFKIYKRPLHLSELEEIIKQNPHYRDIKTNVISSYMDHHREIFIRWGRGVFCTKEYLFFDPAFVKDTYGKLLSIIQQDPENSISISGYYAQNNDFFIAAQIPTPQALFSSLKNLGDQTELSFLKYPIISLRTQSEVLSLRDSLELQLIDRTDGWEINDIVKYAIEKHFVNEASFRSSNIPIRNSLYCTTSKLIHRDRISCEKLDLADILIETQEKLEELNFLSVKKIFDDRPVDCLMLGIDNERYLYSILELFYHEIFDFPYYPLISNKNLNNCQIITSISVLMVQYFFEKGTAFSENDIQEELIIKRGFSDGTIKQILRTTNELIEIQDGLYIHLTLTGLTDNDFILVQELLTEYLHNNYVLEKYVGIVADFLHSYSEKLPHLKNGLMWNLKFICAIINRCENIMQISINTSSPWLFSSKDNPKLISSFDDFVIYIIEKELHGATMLQDFSDYLVENWSMPTVINIFENLLLKNSRLKKNGNVFVLI